MIGQLRGLIVEKQPPLLILEVNGVGYEIDAPMSTFYNLPEIGSEVTLLTHFVVREDAQQLYGFYSREEKVLFRALLKINGVGPKLALTILSSLEPTAFVKAVMTDDLNALVGIPGVGKKTAERLLIEMRDKVASLPISNMNLTATTLQAAGSHETQRASNDAISALISLGFKPQDASRVVAKVDDGTKNSEEIIRSALKEMV